ncbi:MAG: hypothetical protein R3297_10140 [Desulfobulbales bacterium]|nr:hypothetical protein [Desulfobulbales bacterium]
MVPDKVKSEIPLYTKWGIRVSAVIILVLTAMIIKNCMGSIIYGVRTEAEQQKEFYETGYSHGVQRARGLEQLPEAGTDNPLLRKLYHKGYRDGWDSVQAEKKHQANPADTPMTDGAE